MAKRRRASRGAMKAKQPMKKARRSSRRSSKGNRGSSKGVSLLQARSHHDPLGKTLPLPVPGQTAAFVTQNGIIRYTINAGNGDSFFLFSWMPGAQKFFGWHGNRDTIFPRASCFGPYNAKPEDGNQPVSLRPLRMAIRLRNISAAAGVAGTVRTLLAEDTPSIDLTEEAQDTGTFTKIKVTEATKNRWYSFVSTAHASHTFSASELRMTHRWVLKPGQEIPFRSYHDFINPNHLDENHADHSIAEQMLAFGRKQEPLTALVFFIPGTPNNQYELTVHFQDAAQYEPSSPLHGQSRAPPAGNVNTFNNGVAALGAHTPVPTTEH